VKPDRYVGVTTSITKKSYRGARGYLVIAFDLFASAEAVGNGEVPIARGIPGYFNLAGGAASRYALLIGLLSNGNGPRPLRSSDLLGKAFEVDVITVERDGDEKALPEAFHYSKVASVIGRV